MKSRTLGSSSLLKEVFINKPNQLEYENVKIKISIIFILLIVLGVGGVFVWRNVSQSELKNEEETPISEEIEMPSFTPDITHSYDLVINGNEVKIIDNKKYFQQGNIYVKDSAKLLIKNSEFMIGRGDIPTIHVYTIVEKNASLEIENSTIFQNISPEKIGHPTHFVIRAKGKVKIINSKMATHLLEVSDGAQVKIINSTLINKNPPGGLLQTGDDTKIEIIDSTIGALGLRVPADAYLNISGLKSGVCFESWDVHNMIPKADYNLFIKNSCILKDNLTDEYKYGPYERGWLFFLDPNAHVRISNSELRKVFIDLINENIRFENLKIGSPSSLKYRDIELENITIMGEWPFGIKDSNVTINNSDYLFLQPTGKSNIYLTNSQIVEFIPRDFFGVIIFENSSWDIAGEIIGGVPYHSMKNNFTIKGSLKIGQEVRYNLQWKDAQVTREYDVVIKDENNNPVEKALVKINRGTFISDNTGKVSFNIIFDEFEYNKSKKLEVFVANNLIAQKEIDFFTETPIIIYCH